MELLLTFIVVIKISLSQRNLIFYVEYRFIGNCDSYMKYFFDMVGIYEIQGTNFNVVSDGCSFQWYEYIYIQSKASELCTHL